MKKNFHGHVTDLLFSLSLFCAFAVCAFFVITIGAGVYQRIAGNMENTYSTGTAFSYVAEKIRQHDLDGQISLTEVNGADALLLTDEVDGIAYQTCIYATDGALCEIVVKEGIRVSPSENDQILAVEDFTFTDRGNGFLELTAADAEGLPASCLIYIHSGLSAPERK